LQQDPQEVSKGRKRRVVGTIVLLALALIILPQLFDGEGSYQPQIESRIPERPIITLLPQPQQSRPVMVGDVPLFDADAGQANGYGAVKLSGSVELDAK